MDSENTFTSDWLSLREPADHRSRNIHLSQCVKQWGTSKPSLNVVDLGAGLGSNIRYLAPLLGHSQQWILIDNDAVLLDQVFNKLSAWSHQNQYNYIKNTEGCQITGPAFSATVACRNHDLSNSLSSMIPHSTTLITASALLDLCSANWLDELAQLCIEHHIACLFTLNYNGIIQWSNTLPLDNTIIEGVNQHQLRNKGFGAALGPGAASYFAEQFGTSWLVEEASSPWILNANDSLLQTDLIQGWCNAASEISAEKSPFFQQWVNERIEHAKLNTVLEVGHEDLFIRPRADII